MNSQINSDNSNFDYIDTNKADNLYTKASCYDILDGSKGHCNLASSIMPMDLEGTYGCNNYSVSHGPGRENGGTSILSTGCRNYMSLNYNYGATQIPFWINMNSINNITDIGHRNAILSDIRYQTKLWNEAIMYDGTGQIVKLYEVNPGTTARPGNINGRKVIEILQDNLTSKGSAGVFDPINLTVTINYNSGSTTSHPGYNTDTIVHEFGHVLGLHDIDSENFVSNGTHKTVMGYLRKTTDSNLDEAIKYQDIQGIAAISGKHKCQDSNFMRYVKNNDRYLHICFFCDQVDNRTSVISGSKAIMNSTGCAHDFQPIVSAGKRIWLKCTKCYQVTEDSIDPFRQYKLTLENGVNTEVRDMLDGDEISILSVPTKPDYEFEGYYSGENGAGIKYVGAKVEYEDGYYYLNPDNLGKRWYGSKDLTL